MMTTTQLNWVGSSDIKTGYGYFGEKLLEALARRADVAVTPFEQSQLDWPAWKLKLAGIDLAKPTVFVAQPTWSSNFRPMPGRMIVFTMYESETIPNTWVNALNHNCERVLVPCQLNKRIFESHVDIPVDMVPGGVDPNEFPLITDWPDRPFTFVALAERNGMRKGWDLAWAAYSDLFAGHNDTRFIIKTRREDMLFFGEHLSVTDMSIWRQDVPTMAEVYQQADCFVFPTRGEGYGMPPREAACMGVPTIVTNYGGTADNADKWAFPIDYTLTASIMSAGGQWAHPSLDDLRDRMWNIYKYRDAAREKARKHAQWLRDNETWDHAAEKLMEVLRR
jgi:glycosyltransferase involved in cell wall biosynthesis